MSSSSVSPHRIFVAAILDVCLGIDHSALERWLCLARLCSQTTTTGGEPPCTALSRALTVQTCCRVLLAPPQLGTRALTPARLVTHAYVTVVVARDLIRRTARRRAPLLGRNVTLRHRTCE